MPGSHLLPAARGSQGASDQRQACLRIDDESIFALQLLPVGRSTTSIHELFADGATSETARSRIAHHLCRPLSLLPEILRRQESIRFLAERQLLVPFPFRSVTLDSLASDLNLRSDFVASCGERFENGGWTPLDRLRRVRPNGATLWDFAAQAWRLRCAVVDHELPALLRALVDRIEAARSELASPSDPSSFDSSRGSSGEIGREDFGVTVRWAVEAAVELDALNAIALAGAARGGWSFPSFSSGGNWLEIEGLVHPLLEEPVGNDLEITRSRPLHVISGPNMSGKSTLLKAVGAAVLLAQVGAAVPAARMTLAPFTGLVIDSAGQDDVSNGASPFVMELRRLAVELQVCREAGATLMLFDAPFKTTSRADARLITYLLIESLARSTNTVTLLATHDAEAVSPELHGPRVTFEQLGAANEARREQSRYRLFPGVSLDRIGMEIAEAEGLVGALRDVRANAVAEGRS